MKLPCKWNDFSKWFEISKHAIRVKVDAPLSSADVKFLLNQRERPSLSLRLFYEPQLQYIANQNGSAKRDF